MYSEIGESLASGGASDPLGGPGAPMAEVEYVAHVIVMPIVLTIGMVNQCLNICTLYQLPPGGFLYLKASAIADVLSIISFIPFLLRHAGMIDTSCHWCMLYHAHLELPLINALIAASAFCIVAMTVDRYLSVCHPITFFNASDSTKKTVGIILSLFVVAFLVFSPSVWQKKLVRDYDPDLGKYFWILRRNDEVEAMFMFKAYLIFREIISRWGPVCILAVLNFAMIRSLKLLDKRNLRRSIRNRCGRNPRDDRSRISALLVITATTFIICNLPASFLSMFISSIPKTSLFWQSFRALSNLLQTTSYLYNFYLYALCSSEYREAFKKLVGCRQRLSPQSTNDSPTVKMSTNAQLLNKRPLPPVEEELQEKTTKIV